MGSLFGGAPKQQPAVQAGPSPTEIRLEKEAKERKEKEEKRKREEELQRLASRRGRRSLLSEEDEGMGFIGPVGP
jgi:hypothetical protein